MRWLIIILILQGHASASEGRQQIRSNTPPPHLEFDVSSVRQNLSTGSASFSIQPGGRLVASNARLKDLIGFAYSIPPTHAPFLLVGGSERVLTARFDIIAAAASEVSREEALLMLQSLLAERFKLQIHSEVRTIPVYALTLQPSGRLGPNLQPSRHSCSEWLKMKREGGNVEEPRDVNNQPLCLVSPFQPDGYAFAGASEIREIVQIVQSWGAVDRLVVDRTGLSGNYEWRLAFAPPRVRNSRAASVYTAVQEQLGLRLEPQRVPVELRVIDSVEMPSPN